MELPGQQGQNEPQNVPEDDDQVAPEIEPQNMQQDEPPVGPQAVPDIEAEDVDIMNVDSEPEDDPDVDIVNVSEPEDDPDVDIVNVDSEPEDEPQVGPDVEPQGAPEVEPYVEIMRDERTEDEWNELMKRAEFKKEDMNMMVMDFLLAHGLLPAAQAFQKESGCPIPMDSEKLALVETQKIVKDFIFNRQFDDAIRALNEILTPAFLEARPRVRFLLEQQKMIELCRARQFDEALKFSHEFVRWESVELGDDSFKKECRSTMLLMMYGDDDSSPASDLLDTNRMTTISQYVVDNMKTYHGSPTGSHIENAVKMVIHEDYELNKKVLHPCFNFDTGCPKLFYQ